MSTDPSGLEGEETFSQATGIKYINIVFTKEDWCAYKGECKASNLLFNKDYLCLLCEYRRYLHIPDILNKMEEKNGSN